MSFHAVDEIAINPETARVYEHGWQSWSPTTSYPVGAAPYRPVSPVSPVMTFRPGRPCPEHAFQGEGLLGVDPGDGSPMRLYATTDGQTDVASIRAVPAGARVIVSADGAVEVLSGESLATVLTRWAGEYAHRLHIGPVRRAPTAWCSWYHYFTGVTEADIDENVDAIDRHGLPVDVVQIDDGWEGEVGDWLGESDRFESLAALARRIRSAGHRAGIWLAPFVASARSATLRQNPEWVIAGQDGAPADAGHNADWDAALYGFDATHPGFRSYLTTVFERLRGLGFDYFKLDFLYAAALDGSRFDSSSPLSAYRSGLALIRQTVGPGAYLLGCGAPLLPSAGLVDAMRVSPDVAPAYDPPGGDASQASQFGATVSTIGRAWQHGRFWVNDPDCILARPGIERREQWAAVVGRYGGLRASSDRILALDGWGLETTRRLLTEVPPPSPFPDDVSQDAANGPLPPSLAGNHRTAPATEPGQQGKE